VNDYDDCLDALRDQRRGGLVAGVNFGPEREPLQEGREDNRWRPFQRKPDEANLDAVDDFQ
jgi:hypothetical protein